MTTSAGLREIVAEAQAAVTPLQALLEEESRLLGQRDVSGLAALAERKTRLLRELEARDPGRRLGLELDEVEARVTASGDGTLRAQWDAFTAALRGLRQANERNGIAIRRGLETVSMELGILHGADDPASAKSGGDYDARGQTQRKESAYLSTRA